MSIPKHNDMYLPFLEFLRDDQPHAIAEIVNHLSQVMGVTEDERKVTLPSGAAFKFNSRVGWARTYLGKAGLIETIKRSVWILCAMKGFVSLRRPLMEVRCY